MPIYERAIYTGTFDPFTNGHLSIVLRALKLFKKITILVAVSPAKTPFFTMDERVAMIKELFENNNHIIVDHFKGLVVDYAKRNQIGTLVRGLRPTGDFEIEFQMASMNNHLNGDLETVFLMTGGEHYFVSSSLVKEIFTYGGEVTKFVPENILKKLKEKERKQ